MEKHERLPPTPEQDQILLVDKPLRWTSFDVVKKIKFAGQFKKVGHAGTLDPLATGLLIVCTGKLTKTIDSIQNAPKEYEAKITLGYSTPSYDAETEPNAEAPFNHITLKAIEATIAERFSGIIQQVPPQYSAVQVDGQRAYAAARKGKELELKPREVEITYTQVIAFDGQTATITISCSKGTYIRSFAHDLGVALGSLATLTGLIRTKIGNYKLEDSSSIDKIAQHLRQQRLDAEQPAPNLV